MNSQNYRGNVNPFSLQDEPREAGIQNNNYNRNYEYQGGYGISTSRTPANPMTNANPFADPFSTPLEQQQQNQPQQLHHHSAHRSPPIDLHKDDSSKHNFFTRIFHRGEEDMPVYNREGRTRRILIGKRLAGIPYFTSAVTIIQSIVFLYEIIKMGVYTKNIFQTKPYFNPMLGPSSFLEINVGARYLPCMTYIDGVTDLEGLEWPCPNSTSTETDVCSLSELCGLSGIGKNSSGVSTPNQWYRMFTAIFIHAGFVHIFFNFMLQIVVGAKIELYIGIIRYAIIYIAAGIGGFLLGCNFTPEGIASMGCSGALFGSCISLNLLILLLTHNAEHYGINLKSRRAFNMYVLASVVEVVIMIFLGFLPGLDNFSHIGGFLVGIGLGITLLNDPKFVYKPECYHEKRNGTSFMGKRRAKYFYIWCGVRLVMFILTMIYFILLALNFAHKGAKASESCKWCKYLNCLPVNGWCDEGNITITSN